MSQPAQDRRPQEGLTVSKLEPSTHLFYRVAFPRGESDADGKEQRAQAFDHAVKITGNGGLITDVVRATHDHGGSVTVCAILTVSQAVEMLFNDVRSEIGGVSPPFSVFSSPRPTADDADPVDHWLAEKNEEARRLGVARLTDLLTQAGIPGDVASTAEVLWTKCGF